jgi:hypothetical protein
MRFTVQTANDGPQEVLAKIYGPLAVHRKPGYLDDRDPDLWTVTHIQTGLALTEQGKGLPKEQAIQLAERLKDLDWDFINPDKAPVETQDAVLKEIEGLSSRPHGLRF